MRVGIVGAGMAGLGAARTLVASGHEVVVFEKSRGFGGRCATRRVNGYVFDTGATIVSPLKSPLEEVMLNDLSTEGLVVVDKPIFMHSFGRITAVDPQRGAPTRYAYQEGMNTLGKRLADGLDVRLETRVEGLEQPKDGGYALGGETFDAVVLTPPLPQTEEILEQSGIKAKLGNSRYRMCLSIMLGFDRPLEKPYHALLDPDQSQPLTWLSLETVKVPGPFRAPEGHSAVVAQMSARYSRYSFEKDDEKIIKDTVVDVSRILGKEFGSPTVAGVMRWRFSHVSNTLSFESVNMLGSKIVIASDGLVGARLQHAYETGIRAARHLMED